MFFVLQRLYNNYLELEITIEAILNSLTMPYLIEFNLI